jgi:hypothetical protein
MREPILIANGQGFWGDSIDGPIKLGSFDLNIKE